MQNKTIGWDIGGAHVKAAALNQQGEVTNIMQVACPLWKGIQHLHESVHAILATLNAQQYTHVITMTGELADCFTSRQQGVEAIIQAMQQLLNPQPLLIYASQHGFLSLEQIQTKHTMAIASVNWQASAELVSRYCEKGLFVDIGSTTTDLLLIENHQLQAHGLTDYERLVSGELLYTGVVRTSVMAIAQQAIFKQQAMNLMAEHFATMADVYCLTEDLNSAHDQAETADGAEKTPIASARRLSRLTGYEFNIDDWSLWLEFAQFLKNQQKRKIWLACEKQIARQRISTQTCLVGAGVGRFLLKEIAVEKGCTYVDFSSFFTSLENTAELDAGDCAPAVAVAYLGGGFG
ncbi:hydantoinase/oxoprolinase family protein [Methylomonas sp. AM2-LC]|uniref:hydantoinase/oxoprolinase family protein n=1 Tax=Methylomonas sp. AM2-LC TaxID=3153301 RepID=UPI0032675F80